jgi:hypothetical protein
VAAKYSVVAGSGLVDGPMMVALVHNEANTSVRFNLTVIAYEDTVRILMQEFPPLKVARYTVQDVLMPGLERRVRKMESKTSAKFLIGTYDKIKVKLQLDQFRLEVLVNGKPAVTINSRDLFNFEHRRGKQVGGRGEGWAQALLCDAGVRVEQHARQLRGRASSRCSRCRRAHSQACSRAPAAHPALAAAWPRRSSARQGRARLPACLAAPLPTPPFSRPAPRTPTRPAGGRSRSTATPTASPRAPRPSRWTSPSQVGCC